jgi:hypothetical protein
MTFGITFGLTNAGILPLAQGSVTIDTLPSHALATAIGMRGLGPLVQYRAVSHCGAGNCAGGSAVQIGADFAADANGVAVLVDSIQGVCAIEIKEAGGAGRTILCGGPAGVAVEQGRDLDGVGVRVSPNPARERVTIESSAVEGGRIRVDVYDIAGRRIEAVADKLVPAGVDRIEWRLRSPVGSRLRTGVYLVRVRTDAGERRVPLIVVE